MDDKRRQVDPLLTQMNEQVGEIHKCLVGDLDGHPGLIDQVSQNTRFIKGAKRLIWTGVMGGVATVGGGIWTKIKGMW